MIIILTSCQDSSVINVPREYQMPENITVSEKQIAFSVEVNGIAEPLEIVKNQFQCDVFKSNTEPYFVIKTELQNVTGNNSPNCLNSIYFRSDSLCANGEFSSLSGNPADPLLKNAAKIVYVSDSQFEEIIPMELSGNVDNFQVRIFKKGSVFEGEIICSSVLKNGSPLVLRARFSMDPAKE
ncbi:MAG TPA: hypothetical protein VEC36_01380 [Patescibacteria group bacterium]|nr:hypothetical protein [Patescibacteria group bacterium]